MKALAVDSTTSCISFAARSGDKTALLSLDIGMHQSEKILEGIQYVLAQCSLRAEELDYTALCAGPGTFTGLRLAFSALKAFNLAYGIPVYGIHTLEAAAYPYRQWQGAVVPALDAKKNSFYAAVYRSGVLQAGPFDESTENILNHIDREENMLITGSDAFYFAEQVYTLRPEQKISIFSPLGENSGIGTTCIGMQSPVVLALLEMAEKKFIHKESALEEYEGPIYIRKSEAELSLLQKTGQNA